MNNNKSNFVVQGRLRKDGELSFCFSVWFDDVEKRKEVLFVYINQRQENHYDCIRIRSSVKRIERLNSRFW